MNFLFVAKENKIFAKFDAHEYLNDSQIESRKKTAKEVTRIFNLFRNYKKKKWKHILKDLLLIVIYFSSNQFTR